MVMIRGPLVLVEHGSMVRSFFLAVGICLMSAGAECLAVEKIVLKAREAPAPQATLLEEGSQLGSKKTITPAVWTPWTLLGSGAIVCIYSFTLPIRMKG